MSRDSGSTVTRQTSQICYTPSVVGAVTTDADVADYARVTSFDDRLAVGSSQPGGP